MSRRFWDMVGYAIMATFAINAAQDPEFFLFLMLFGFIALLIWGAVMERATADKP